MLGNKGVCKVFLCSCDYYDKFSVYAKSSSVGQSVLTTKPTSSNVRGGQRKHQGIVMQFVLLLSCKFSCSTLVYIA